MSTRCRGAILKLDIPAENASANAFFSPYDCRIIIYIYIQNWNDHCHYTHFHHNHFQSKPTSLADLFWSALKNVEKCKLYSKCVNCEVLFSCHETSYANESSQHYWKKMTLSTCNIAPSRILMIWHHVFFLFSFEYIRTHALFSGTTLFLKVFLNNRAIDYVDFFLDDDIEPTITWDLQKHWYVLKHPTERRTSNSIIFQRQDYHFLKTKFYWNENQRHLACHYTKPF